VLGTIGLLIGARKKRLTGDVQAALDESRNRGDFRISQRLYDHASDQADE
jgi:predicted nucleic acid-binding protein